MIAIRLPIHLIHHPRAECWAITWSFRNIICVKTGMKTMALAIAAANDLCAHLNLTPEFQR